MPHNYANNDVRKWFGVRMNALEKDQQLHVQKWQDIKQYICPKYGRFFNRNKTQQELPDYTELYNNTPTQALNTNSAFLMAGMSSPARPWFKLRSGELGQELSGESKDWLDYYRDEMLQVFSQSNLYHQLPLVYREAVAFGNSMMMIQEDKNDLIRFYHFPIGTYYFGVNHRMEVDTIYRPFQMTVKQLVDEYGLYNCSKQVQRMYNNPDGSQLHQPVSIVNCIEPNKHCLPKEARPIDSTKKYVSVSYETSTNADPDKFLRVEGYREFPAMVMRIEPIGSDPYGIGAGHDLLGDCKELQHHEYTKAVAMDYVVEPHLQSDGTMGEMFRFPSAVTPKPPNSVGGGFEPIYEVNFPFNEIDMSIQKIEQRIKDGFDNYLARKVIDNERSNVTAREIDAGENEKLLLAGPKLESIQLSLGQIIDRTFEIMMFNNIGDPPPEELGGMNLNIEYLGIMAQAQKAVGTQSIEKLYMFASNISQMYQGSLDIFDNLDADESLRDYANMIGAPSDQILDKDDVAQKRQVRQQQQSIQQMSNISGEMADTAKTMSETDISKDSALKEALELTGG